MNRNMFFETLFATLLLAGSAHAGSVSFDTNSYSFKLAGGGGGGTATLEGVSVNVFCDDFADKVTFPQDYSANVTTLSTDANLDQTRFGQTASNRWSPISLTGRSKTLKQEKEFFNQGAGSSALARYEMAAYLVSLYSVGQGNSLSNNEIQEAIWVLLDPATGGSAPNPAHVNPTNYLGQASSWYSSMNTPGNLDVLDAFLGGFEIVSPTNMTFKRNGLRTGGFQEMIATLPAVVPSPLHTQVLATPEPRDVSLLSCRLARDRRGLAAQNAQSGRKRTRVTGQSSNLNSIPAMAWTSSAPDGRVGSYRCISPQESSPSSFEHFAGRRSTVTSSAGTGLFVYCSSCNCGLGYICDENSPHSYNSFRNHSNDEQRERRRSAAPRRQLQLSAGRWRRRRASHFERSAGGNLLR